MERGSQQSFASGSDGFTQAMELVASTFLFGLLGFWLDGRLGTRPLFAVVLGGLALLANVIKLYCTYGARMRAEEEGKPWARQR